MTIAYMLKIVVLVFGLLMLSACASAPVQEMSDARQAIQSAEEAGAEQVSPQQFRSAQQLLEQAQQWLQRGVYTNAKQFALDARDEAIRAREIALERNPN